MLLDQDPLFPYGEDKLVAPARTPALPSWAGSVEQRVSPAYADLGGGIGDHESDRPLSTGKDEALRIARQALNRGREEQGKPPIPYGTSLPDNLRKR